MKLYDGVSIALLIIVSVSIVIGAVNYIYDEYWPDDNVAEEAVEKAIEENIGFQVDLTPKTPEK